jgi:hypothetical protein
MKMREALWTAVAAATAFRPRFIRPMCKGCGRRAVAAATAVQSAFGTAIFIAEAAARRSRNQMVIGWRSDPSPACGPKRPLIPVPRCPFGGRRPGGAWPPPSPLGEGSLITILLPGEKVLRYEADEGSLGSKLRLSARVSRCLPRKQEVTLLHCRGHGEEAEMNLWVNKQGTVIPARADSSAFLCGSLRALW